ncbi:MAG: FIG015287: Zinc protease [uncultured Thiotrichaceae bacterium]|uniref:FIG015287: Zinc protease n=1 Tax=uncultured Thiotrichaceae bacterium TaxID=298394 RepID=A0A6S6U6N7_9GAMM|nr:MAG: FIG015287: Zinc protease [uncultured Thiotrichaceae bacterium]
MKIINYFVFACFTRTPRFLQAMMTCGVLLLLTPSAFAGPDIQTWTTDKGLRVYFVAAPQLPMLDIRLTFAAGGVRDGEQAGLAMMTSSSMNDGAGGLSADQLAEAFESVGAIYGGGSARDMAWFSLRTLTLEAEKKTALATWLKVIGQPEFPEKEFKNAQKLALVGLQAEKQSPGAIGNKAFMQALYGDHPYASPEDGTEESIAALTTEQLKAFYKQYYVARNGVLAIVGAVDRQQAEALAEQVSAVLDEGKRAAKIPEVQPLAAARTIHIPFPSQQAHIMMGQPGNKRGDEDYFSLYLGNQILGGSGFTARLTKEIRDKRGLSYSVYSYFSPMEQFGPFQIGLQTKLSQTDEALTVAQETLKTYRAEGPSDNELGAAKKDITGGFPLRTASNSNIISYLAMIGFYDLPLDYLDTFTGKVEAISQEQIVDAFQRRLDPDKMLTVIVGGEEKKDETTTDATDSAESSESDESGEAAKPASE